MYDKDSLNGMTETTKKNPSSKKGLVRKQIAHLLLDESKKRNIQVLIERSADYYDPSIKNTSIITEMVLKNLAQNKKAMWLSSVNYKHSFTFTTDAQSELLFLETQQMPIISFDIYLLLKIL